MRWRAYSKSARPRGPGIPTWLLLAVVFLAGCHQASHSAPGSKPLAVAVSIAPQAWLVEEISGGAVDVAVLVRPGESPATFQPNDAEVSRIMRSALYFRIGVPFEKGPWFEALVNAGGPRIIDLRQDIERRPIGRHAHADPHEDDGEDFDDGEDLDPHIWLSPPLLAIQARTVAAALADHDPDHRADYEARLASLEARLADLDRRLEERLAPLAGRAFFVFHPVWGYFADRYGLRQIAIEVAGREPTDRELTELQRRAREEDAAVIFVQPQIKSRAAEAVAKAIGGRVEILDPLRRDVAAGLEEAAERLLAAHGEEE